MGLFSYLCTQSLEINHFYLATVLHACYVCCLTGIYAQMHISVKYVLYHLFSTDTALNCKLPTNVRTTNILE